MGVEIERKFLVAGDDWRSLHKRRFDIVQGYLSTDPDRTIRVRLCDDAGILTIKGRPRDLVRAEFEYEIPGQEARELIEDLCVGFVVEKTRFVVPWGDHLWEVDEFRGHNRGLVVAEVELESADEEFERPPWVGDEVTDQVLYYNARLAQKPYEQW